MKNNIINYLSVRFVQKRFYCSNGFITKKDFINIDLLKKNNVHIYKRFIANISFALINFYNTITFNTTLTTYKRFFNLVQKALITLANTVSLKIPSPVKVFSTTHYCQSLNNFIFSVHTSYVKIQKQLSDINITPKISKVIYRSLITSVLNAFNKLHNIQKAKPAAKPVAKPTTKPAAKPTTKPAAKPTTKTAAKSVTKVSLAAKPLSLKETELLKNLIKNNELLLKNFDKSKN
jgi:hypothetical protein